MLRFVNDGGFSLVGEPDPDTGEYVVRVYSNLRPAVPPPPRISVLVGDALNNMRSALDYVVWRLAKSPSRKNQFPIFDDPERFKKERERYLATVPKALWAKFETHQPYPGKDANRGLAVLAQLNDVDKHRLLLAGAHAVATGMGKFTVRGLDGITITGRDWVPFEDGAELYRMRLNPHAGSKVDVKAEVPFTIVFGDPDGGLAINLRDLRNIRLTVANVVESFRDDF